MPLDASYDQLMRLLSARGLEWFRQRVMDLPDPLPADHPDIAALALAGRMAPVLSGLRGHVSPLEDIVTRRLGLPLILAASARTLEGDSCPRLAGVVLAGGLLAADQPLWRLAMAALADDMSGAPADRLAAGARADEALVAEAEAVICCHGPVDAAGIDRLSGVLMQLYAFGAARPQFSHPRIYGTAFARLLRCADWAGREGSIIAMAQTAYCLRLIDADHDIAPLIAEIIANQRPDGSFPAEASHCARDQDLLAGAWPTLMALAALNLAAWKRWRGPRPDAGRERPFSSCRDHVAAALAPQFAVWAQDATPAMRLTLAAVLTRASGENWFLRMGLRRVAPSRAQLIGLSARLFGDPYAARHARQALNLQRHWPHDLEQGSPGDALRWLRGAPVALRLQGPFAPPDADSVGAGGCEAFDRSCQAALAGYPAAISPAWRASARHHARLAIAAMDAPARLSPAEALEHLHRLCLIAHIVEGDSAMAAAA